MRPRQEGLSPDRAEPQDGYDREVSKKKRPPATAAKNEPKTDEKQSDSWRSRWTDTTWGERMMLGVIFFFLILALLRQYLA